MNNSSNRRLINCREAAAYLGITEQKLCQLRKSNRIQIVRIDKSVRYDIDDLDAFIKQAKEGG